MMNFQLNMLYSALKLSNLFVMCRLARCTWLLYYNSCTIIKPYAVGA